MATLYSWLINSINALIRGLGAVLSIVLSLLPNSPFQSFIKSDSTVAYYLKYINYFIPVAIFVEILSSYLIAVALFNIVQIVARWLKLIE